MVDCGAEEADHAANAGLGFGDQQPLLLEGIQRSAGLESGKVVVEYESSGVCGVADAAGAGIARAKIAGGVVIGLRGGGLFFHLSLPRPLRAVRRDQHPFTREGVEAAVRILCPIEHAPSC